MWTSIKMDGLVGARKKQKAQIDEERETRDPSAEPQLMNGWMGVGCLNLLHLPHVCLVHEM